jgi:hypothetical protein
MSVARTLRSIVKVSSFPGGLISKVTSAWRPTVEIVTPVIFLIDEGDPNNLSCAIGLAEGEPIGETVEEGPGLSIIFSSSNYGCKDYGDFD